MTVLSLPSSAGIARMRWELQRNDVMDGVQALRASDPLWRVSLECSPDLEANSGYLKALFMRLRGGVHQLELHDWARPAPVGTMRGVLSLASSVAAGATSMSVVAANDNLLTFSEAFDNSIWFKGVGTSLVNVTPNAALAPDGTNTADNAIPPVTATNGPILLQTQAVTAGQALAWSVYLQQIGSYRARIQLNNTAYTNGYRADFNPSNGTVSNGVSFGAASAVSFVTEALPNNWWRLGISCLIDGVATSALCGLYVLNGSGTFAYTPDGVSGLRVWGGKLNVGNAPTAYGYGKTLKKGDLLGIRSGTTQQVVMVTEDAVSTSQGNITVQFQPPLRNSFSAGQSVVWDKPKALFRRVSNELGWDYRGKNPITSGMTLDLVEDWRA